jgi:hypothetical protein
MSRILLPRLSSSPGFPNNGAILEHDDYARITNMVPDLQSTQNEGLRHFVDLVLWKRAFAALRAGELRRGQHIESGKFDIESRSRAASDVLDGLKSDEAVFTDLRAASQRPFVRYPVTYAVEKPMGDLVTTSERHQKDLWATRI